MKNKSRWPYLLAAVVTGFFNGTLYTWSYIRDELGYLFPAWSAGDLSFVFSIHNAIVCASLIATGLLLKRVSNRTMLFIAGVAMAVGFGLFPFLPVDQPDLALVMIVVLFSIIAASSVGMTVVAGYALYTQWAPDHPGKLLGAMTLAHSISPIILGAICSWLIPIVGTLHAVRWVGAGSAVLLFATLPLAKPPGPDYILPPPAVPIDSLQQKEFTPREMLRVPAFWFLFAFNMVIRTSGLIIVDFGGSIAIYFGMSALAGMLYSPANGLANIVGGFLTDKFGAARVMVMCGCALLVGATLLLIGNAAGIGALAIAGILAGGLSYGCCIVLSATSMRNLFGPKSYAQNFSYVQTSILLAAFGGFLAGSLLDRQQGSFRGVFILLLCFALVGVGCGLVMGVYTSKRNGAA